jgi:hypothetical protein
MELCILGIHGDKAYGYRVGMGMDTVAGLVVARAVWWPLDSPDEGV